MSGDWLKLHRSILDTAVWPDPWLLKLWIWCLCRANFADGQYMGMAVRRGQFVTGRKVAADVLGVTESRWYRGLKKLESLGYVVAESNNKWTTITVCNYDTYQSADDGQRTTNEQPTNNQRTTSEQPANTSKKKKNLRIHTHTPEADVDENEPVGFQVVAADSQFLPPAPKAVLRLPESADSARNRDQIEKWQEARFRQHGARTSSVAWDAEAMLHSHWTEAQWFSALVFSTSKGSKSLLDPSNDFQRRRQANGFSRPEATYKPLEPIE